MPFHVVCSALAGKGSFDSASRISCFAQDDIQFKRKKRDNPLRGSSLCNLIGLRLEEDLQRELDSPRDVALAAGVAKITVGAVRKPELIHGAEEHPIKSVACV